MFWELNYSFFFYSYIWRLELHIAHYNFFETEFQLDCYFILIQLIKSIYFICLFEDFLLYFLDYVIDCWNNFEGGKNFNMDAIMLFHGDMVKFDILYIMSCSVCYSFFIALLVITVK